MSQRDKKNKFLSLLITIEKHFPIKRTKKNGIRYFSHSLDPCSLPDRNWPSKDYMIDEEGHQMYRNASVQPWVKPLLREMKRESVEDEEKREEPSRADGFSISRMEDRASKNKASHI